MDSPFHPVNLPPHCFYSQPLPEGGNHSRILTEKNLEAEKAPRPGQIDSSRGIKEAGMVREGGFGAGQTAGCGPVRAANRDSMRTDSGGIDQHDLQAHANASYAQHLYGLLAAQAQVG